MGTKGRTPAGRSAAMPIGNRARIVAGVLMALYVLEVGAATLIVCSDGGEVHGDVDYITALASHSDEVNRIVTDPQFSVDGVVRLNITTGQLDKICRFIWKLDQYTITWAVQWVNDMIDTFGYTMEQLVEMAAYIKIRALTVSIAWHSRNDEYYGAAPSDDYWVSIRQRERPYHFVAGIVRLHWLATGIRELTKLVRDICRVLVVRGTADRIIAKPFLNWANVLEYAAGHGEEFILEVLLDLPGVGVNDHIDAGTGNRTLLHCSAMNGHLGVVNLLVGWPGIVADLQDALLWTPLHYAVQYGHAAIVDVLLDAKVNRGVSIDLNKRDGNGLTPYTLAFNTRQGSVMAALERCGGYM